MIQYKAYQEKVCTSDVDMDVIPIIHVYDDV